MTRAAVNQKPAARVCSLRQGQASAAAMKRPSSAGRPSNKRRKGKSALKGTFVYETAQKYMSMMSAEKRAAFCTLIRSHRWEISSACTGTGSAEVAHQCLMEVAGGKHILQFSCENNVQKQQFLLKIVEPVISDAEESCLFVDLVDLSSGCCTCVKHLDPSRTNSACEVPLLCDLFVAGFSCKDLSTLSRKFTCDTSTSRDSVLQEGLGSTGVTFQGVLRHANRAKPRIIVLENVSSLGKPGNANLQYLWESFKAFGLCRSL